MNVQQAGDCPFVNKIVIAILALILGFGVVAFGPRSPASHSTTFGTDWVWFAGDADYFNGAGSIGG